MKFSAVIVAAFAAVAIAAPGEYRSPGKDVTIEQAQNSCGNSQLYCCNKSIQANNNEDVSTSLLNLGKLIGGGNGEGLVGGLFGQCSKLTANVNVIGGAVSDLLNQNCKTTAACCQNTNSEANGVVAVALPCIPVAAL
ncbi:hypothetical protein AJ80_01188 [Polytolypa hystricis UAMH7299]|uniref:Hydrophobin n=1 Tax=Polytolypa hystricis (strain UAMH7299) TaxID=1447883 RepID=A0A2B7Z1N3_POLH7|nr:hypothetical protein AJ80_01188 [Polytolypa hystricis UAMH7299]